MPSIHPSTLPPLIALNQVLKVSKASKKYCGSGLGKAAWLKGEPLTGAYPPALQEILASKEDFAQVIFKHDI